MSNRGDLEYLISLIDNSEIRDFTVNLLRVAPEVFWTSKASRGHHPLDERGPEGNLLHTVRVVRLNRVMAECCGIAQLGVDVLTSAGVLHDSCRYGLFGTEEFSVPNHPLLVRELANQHGISCRYFADIISLVEKHMGRWGDPPYIPEMTPSAILHIADAVSAHAEEIWGNIVIQESSWVGGVPFKEIGMTEQKMQLLEGFAEDNDYWSSALLFIRKVSSRKLSSLSERQRNWLYDIDAALGDELNKQDAKKAYEDDLEPEDIPF